MATRILPGVYVSLNDMSQFPEGATSLNVGYVLKANRGPVNEFSVVTSPNDFLTQYTFSGAPASTSDPTFFSILKVLAQTNSVYVVRAANNPLYGGAVVKKVKDYGTISEISADDNTITLSTTGAPSTGEKIIVTNSVVADGYYTVKSASGKKVTVEEDIKKDYPFEGAPSDLPVLRRCPIQPLPNFEIAIASIVPAQSAITFTGDYRSSFPKGSKFLIEGAATAANNKEYTVSDVTFDETTTTVTVLEEIAAGEGAIGHASIYGLTKPSLFNFQEDSDALFIITGIDPGVYNGQLQFTIVSSEDNEEDNLPYEDVIQLNVIDPASNMPLESFMFSLDENAKAIDGTSLYFENVVAGSAYIQIVNKEGNTELPGSTFGFPAKGGNGSNGGTVDATVIKAALEVFKDKTIPISILGSNCSAEAEGGLKDLQDAMLELATERKDVMVFLNSRKSDENQTLPSQRIKNIVDYKKKTLGSTTFYGCMYTPHVKTSDPYNQRQVDIGADAVAIAGWLDVINNLNFPYAYAGPLNGLVTGVTCDWKIGDTSGEAAQLNDASINYVAYDGKVGRYYMQSQNTLQIANSAMRNIGTVLNVLDIKERLAVSLKEYLQLPITDTLRAQILDTCNDFLAPMQGVRFYQYSFQDVTTDADLAQDTLRYLLILSPTRYAQKIFVVMNIVNSTFDFSILQSA